MRTAIFAVPAVLLVCLVSNEIHTDRQYDTANAALQTARNHMARIGTDLASVRRNLQVVGGQINQTTAALTNDTTQLHEIQEALTNAQANVSTQQSTIGSLHACLAGVEQSLNALAVGDANSADQALTSVAPDCTRVLTADG